MQKPFNPQPRPKSGQALVIGTALVARWFKKAFGLVVVLLFPVVSLGLGLGAGAESGLHSSKGDVTFARTVAPSVSFQTQTHRSLEGINNILFDVRASRGGNGDVAPSYLFAMDLRTRFGFQGSITFVTDPASAKILETLTGLSLSSPGAEIPKLQAKVYAFEAIPQQMPAVDLYIALSRLAGTIDLQTLKSEASNLSDTYKIPVDPETIFISQVALGNTDPKFTNSLGLLQQGVSPTKEYRLAAPGLGPCEVGVYTDPVALSFKGQSQSAVRVRLKTLLPLIRKTQDRELVSALLDSEILQTGDFGLSYGISARVVSAQYESYLKGVAKYFQSSGKPVTILTPSGFALNSIQDPVLKSKINLITEASQFSNLNPQSKITVIKTSALPHEIFIGLMAYSTLPVVVAGDNAASAAINLAKAFVMTRVASNAQNVENYGQRLARNVQSKEGQRLALTLFPPANEPSNLEEAMFLLAPEMQAAIKRTATGADRFTVTVLQSLGRTRGKISAPVMQAQDPLFEFSKLLNDATSTPEGFAKLEQFLKAYPLESLRALSLVPVPRTLEASLQQFALSHTASGNAMLRTLAHEFLNSANKTAKP